MPTDELTTLTAVNADDLEWADTRFPTSFVKVLMFRDGVNFELNRVEKGNHTFPHSHGFWQLRYILEGDFLVNGETYGPGTLIDFPALQKYEVFTPEGGLWIIVQMPDPATGYAPKDPTGKAYGGPEEAS
jgi:hypothetical protein